jgi:hypothetical protein
MEAPTLKQGTSRQVQEHSNIHEGLSNAKIQQIKEAKSRPSNVKPISERKIIARPNNTDDDLLNKLFENQG